MKVLMCGSRTFADEWIVRVVLAGADWLSDAHLQPLEVIHGAAPGADLTANNIARESCTKIERFPADWDAHGKAAGPIRNQRMIDEGKPDVVLAFVDKPLVESRGTADMVRRAHSAGVPVYVIHAMTGEAHDAG